MASWDATRRTRERLLTRIHHLRKALRRALEDDSPPEPQNVSNVAASRAAFDRPGLGAWPRIVEVRRDAHGYIIFHEIPLTVGALLTGTTGQGGAL